MNNFRDLQAWQKAMDLVEEVDRASRGFPTDEKYGLVSQIRRAAVSVPSNIAEGHSRPTADFVRFLNIARGSLSEVETQMELAQRLGFIADITNVAEQAAETGRILNGLIRALRTRDRGSGARDQSSP